MNNFFKVLALLIFLLLISSCNDQRHGRIAKSNVLIEKKDGLIYKQKSEKPYTGVIRDTLSNKIMEYHVKDGLKNGLFKVSNPDGKVEIIGNIVNDKNEGEWKYYYPDGKLESIGEFKNDTPSGKWTFYYQTGLKKEEGNYDQGLRDGKWIEYDSSGKVIKDTIFTKKDSVK